MSGRKSDKALEVPIRLRDCIIGFIIAIIGGALAGLSFSMISSRLLAGAVAGAGFLIVGGYLLRASLKAKSPYTWLTFYTSLIHLFGISIPMLVVRWQHPDLHFSQLEVWGISGPEFHLYSMYFYRVLLLGLVIDGLRAWWVGRLQKKSQA
ncbi:MAG: hypothetical protein KDD34_02330 [Bdellovibrionales bacterium]|nr:hypothetical protein [Bdellovibrionales bacterium]